ncbi:Uncharacterised protein [Mycobacteroides abscessus subsp. abscessus]|nr:Uncharacterised protein [Mycobacteroides abscessus subsp. abscessus]
MYQLLTAVDTGPHLGRQFFDAGQTATRHRLIRRHDQPGKPGRVVQYLQNRHRGHGRAIRVGDDALGQFHPAHVAVEVDLRDHQRHVRILAPGRRVVDDRDPGLREPRGLHPGHGGPGGEQRDVQPGRIGRLGVLDLDLLAAECQLLALGPSRGEEAHRRSRELTLFQKLPHDGTHLPGGTDYTNGGHIYLPSLRSP